MFHFFFGDGSALHLTLWPDALGAVGAFFEVAIGVGEDGENLKEDGCEGTKKQTKPGP